MNIGGYKISGNILFAPLAGVTNLAYRLLCKQHGASVTYTEMISSDAVLNNNPNTFRRAMTCKEEGIMGIQLFGNSPENITSAARILEERYSPPMFDINLGCPFPVVTKNGGGSALLRSMNVVQDIFMSLSENIATPVSAKMRVLGSIDETVRIARLIEDAGACAITVHGRTRSQKYGGTSDLEYAKRIKSELSIPIIVNGDIRDETSAEHALAYTGCDGLMIGRAAMGDPRLFDRIFHYLETGEYLAPATCAQRRDDLVNYVRLLERFDLLGSMNIRSHAQWFTRGLDGSRKVRQMLNDADDVSSIIECFDILCDPSVDH
ncbi:MAG: tRNA-dihydrouridine synthase, partial [Euryarchaeota archaeon]|nr:tRNA-dihydrouridine synthase [Euryarchaeota archaeon]